MIVYLFSWSKTLVCKKHTQYYSNHNQAEPDLQRSYILDSASLNQIFNLHLRDVTKVSFGFLSFWNFYLLRTKCIPGHNSCCFPLFPFMPTHVSFCPLFNSIHLACSCSLIPLFQSQLFLPPSCLLTLLLCTGHWSPFLLQRPSPTFSSTYFASTFQFLLLCPCSTQFPRHLLGFLHPSPPALHVVMPAFLQAAMARLLRRQRENQSGHCTVPELEEITNRANNSNSKF